MTFLSAVKETSSKQAKEPKRLWRHILSLIMCKRNHSLLVSRNIFWVIEVMGALMNGISAVGNRPRQGARLPFHHGHHSEKTTVHAPGSGLGPGTEIACTLISDLRTVRMTCLLFMSHLDVGFLLEQSEQDWDKTPAYFCVRKQRSLADCAPNCIGQRLPLGDGVGPRGEKVSFLTLYISKREKPVRTDS